MGILYLDCFFVFFSSILHGISLASNISRVELLGWHEIGWDGTGLHGIEHRGSIYEFAGLVLCVVFVSFTWSFMMGSLLRRFTFWSFGTFLLSGILLHSMDGSDNYMTA